MMSTAARSSVDVRSGESADSGAAAEPWAEAESWAEAGPWTVRVATPRRGRAALEVYENGELLDVLVASSLSPEPLRGARRSSAGGDAAGFAWGRLPADGPAPSVFFTQRRPGRFGATRRPAAVVTVAGAFWLARAEGRCGSVLVHHGSGSPVRLRARQARGRQPLIFGRRLSAWAARMTS